VPLPLRHVVRDAYFFFLPDLGVFFLIDFFGPSTATASAIFGGAFLPAAFFGAVMPASLLKAANAFDASFSFSWAAPSFFFVAASFSTSFESFLTSPDHFFSVSFSFLAYGHPRSTRARTVSIVIGALNQPNHPHSIAD
jgi:hypothetical protein